MGSPAGAALAEWSVPDDGAPADGSLADGSLDGEPAPDVDGQPAGVVLLDPDRTGADEPDCDADPEAGELDALVPADPDDPGAADVGVALSTGHEVVPLPVGEADVAPDRDADVLGSVLGSVLGCVVGPGAGCSAGGRPGFTGGAVGGGTGPGSLGSTGTVRPGTPRAYTASSERTVARYASEWL